MGLNAVAHKKDFFFDLFVLKLVA